MDSSVHPKVPFVAIAKGPDGREFPILFFSAATEVDAKAVAEEELKKYPAWRRRSQWISSGKTVRLGFEYDQHRPPLSAKSGKIRLTPEQRRSLKVQDAALRDVRSAWQQTTKKGERNELLDTVIGIGEAIDVMMEQAQRRGDEAMSQSALASLNAVSFMVQESIAAAQKSNYAKGPAKEPEGWSQIEAVLKAIMRKRG